MDISNLSLNELTRLNARIKREIDRRASTVKKDLLKRYEQMAREEGLALVDVIGPGASTAPTTRSPAPRTAPKKTALGKKPAAAKYRNPADASMTWSGRGRKPHWVEDHLKSGGSLEALQIAAA